MENQKIENEVKVEEVVETEGKTKFYKSSWFKNTLLVVGGIVVGAVVKTFLDGDSENDEDGLYLEDSDVEGEILLEQNSEGRFEVVDEFKKDE